MEIDWVQLIAGSLIPIIGYFFRLILISIKNNRLKKSIMGEWYSYHISRVNYKDELRVEKWKISTKLFREGINIKVLQENSTKNDLKYTGKIEFDNNFVIFHITGKEHSEINQTRLTKPIPNGDTLMIGFHLAQDFNHELYTTPKLVCRRKRSHEEAVKILKESTEWIEDEICIRLTKRPIPSLEKPSE
ncbi:hypothetical protein BFP97_01520 [Roseivirga sp. 4D4]|uniref:hypothetical protein n=1 Tax=Roseivirga sp. 4D4 TaxID=1889784 RepID=UPI0008531F9E|nr:hypothetical protein [Roseivirga sp. 4D4]OEK00270.1 hypothetical protein BFP97_01520 [Roseivirga sp. 4D4]